MYVALPELPLESTLNRKFILVFLETWKLGGA